MSASPALAASCPPPGQSPPANSEISQYAETVPGACGDRNVGGGGGSGDNGGATGSGSESGGSGAVSGVPAASIHKLEQLGPAGAQAARFAQATADKAQSPRGGGPSIDVSGDDGSILGALGSSLSGGSDEGSGALMPILLATVLLAGVAFLALRRRRTG